MDSAFLESQGLQGLQGTLAGRTVVVTGITGQVGWGAAAAALAAGARVLAIARDPAAKDGIRASLGHPERLDLVFGDLSDGPSARGLGELVAAAGPVHHVFAALGPWWQKGRTVDQTPQEYAAVRAGLLDAQVHAAMVLLPLVLQREGGSYTIVTGAGGHMQIPGTGLLVVAVNGVFALARTLRAEHASDSIAIHELLIEARIERQARDGVVPAARLGAAAVGLMLGQRPAGVHRFSPSAQWRD